MDDMAIPRLAAAILPKVVDFYANQRGLAGLLGMPSAAEQSAKAQQASGEALRRGDVSGAFEAVGNDPMLYALGVSNMAARGHQALAMDTPSRMARAKNLGFSEQPLYHATTAEFKAFDPNKAGSATTVGGKEKAVFLTNRPDAANDFVSRGYVNEGGKAVQSFATGARVMPVRVRNLENFDWWDMPGTAYNPAFVERALNQARKASRSGVVFNGMKDMGYFSTSPKQQTIVAVFDPKNIRSQFAAFDPAKSESADLLAYQPKVLQRDATGRPLERVSPPPPEATERLVRAIMERLP